MAVSSPVPGLVVASALLLASAACAQTSEDRAYIGISVGRGTAIGTQGGKLDERWQLDLRLPLPPVFLGKSILLPSLGFETYRFGLEQQGVLANVPENQLSRSFYRLQLGLSLIRPVTPRWLIIAGAVGSTRTDFRGSFDPGMDTTWVGYAMANYKIGGDPDKKLTFGLVALWPFDFTPVIPMLSFVYRKEGYIVELGVPRFTLLRKIGDTLELGLIGVFEQQVFHALLPEEGRALGAYYVRSTSLRFAPTANIRLGSGSLWLNTSIGLDVLNDHALLDKHRDPLNLGNNPTRPAPYARLTLSWRPPRPTPRNTQPVETE
ncbi:hypothetical protein [Hyalangium versicolor]|uniref:hypothetical protein n=1 Tax=Hyalangium versicolor TaxID=2861190 RepID=UPI001CCF64A6|nr:hypothetical protein [Hyalangium versicolor]